MKGTDVRIGQKYTAAIQGRIYPVRIVGIRLEMFGDNQERVVFDVLNLSTQKVYRFSTAAKLRPYSTKA